MAENESNAMSEDEITDQLSGDEIIGELSEDDPVERAVFIALDEAAGKLDEQGDFEPFIVIVDGDELRIEEQEGDDVQEILASARQTLSQMANVADAYILTYDGYVDLDDGQSDAIIVEYARTGELEAQVLAWLYQTHGDHVHFQEPLYSLGSYPSLFAAEDTATSDEAESAAAIESVIEAVSAATPEAASPAAEDDLSGENTEANA